MLKHTRAQPDSSSRVVVLGGSGFIGTHLVPRLRAGGVDAVAVSSRQIDLTDPGAVDALAKMVGRQDSLVLISCLTRDKGTDAATLVKNVTMAAHVSRFVERHGCGYFLNLSSDAVFKDGTSLVAEDSEQAPGELYGTAHVARERILQYSCEKAGIPLATLRPCGVYGPGDTHNGYGPNRFLRTAIADGKIALFGGGEEKRDHIFVDDVTRLIELTVRHKSVGTLNVATGTALPFSQVAEAVAAAVSRPVVITTSPRRSPITHRHFDVTAILSAFPSFTFTRLDEGLRRTVAAIAPAPS